MREKTRQKYYTKLRKIKQKIVCIDINILNLQKIYVESKKHYPYISNNYNVWKLNNWKNYLLDKIQEARQKLGIQET